WDEIVERYGVDSDTPTGKRAKVAWSSISFEDAALYCADDAAQTRRLHDWYSNEATAQDRAVLDFERRVDAVVAGSEDRGFLRNVPRAAEYRHQLADNRARSIAVLHQDYGMAAATDTQFRLLLERLGAPLHKKTPTGKWAVDKKVRETLALSEERWGR